VPKIGPFKALDFKIPTQQTEDLYVASVNHTLDNYRSLLVEVEANSLALPNTDFDTGKPTQAGEYALGDATYAYLVDKLSSDNFENVTPELRQNILGYYSNPAAPIATKRKAAQWQKTQDELQRLKGFTPLRNPVPAKAASAL
jgi:hypothetical protein